MLSLRSCFFPQFLDPVKAGQPTRVEVTFTNKLKVHMTNVIYSINGRGLTRTMVQERYATNSLLAVWHDLVAALWLQFWLFKIYTFTHGDIIPRKG